MEKIYYQLLDMCKNIDFNISLLEEMIHNIDPNKELIEPSYTKARTTLLSTATTYANIEMVRLLLKHGANPNHILYEDKILEQENPFWDLQYNDFGETEEENEVGLQMAQLMLEHGANPCIKISGEDLFSYVCFAVFNDFDRPELWEYRSRFFILLIAYGGKSESCRPQIIKEFDKKDMSQYSFLVIPHEDGYHLIGEIRDGNYELIARV